MITIDLKALEEHIRFTVEHHGTRTQGEVHRFDQVAENLTQTFKELIDLLEAAQEVPISNTNLYKISVLP